jgi:predicted phage terminase large subunit-like protein
MLTALSQHESVAEAKLSALRRETGAHGLLAFVRTYLPHYFKKQHSRMHAELAAELEKMTGPRGERGARLAVAAPRGHAKSTLVTLGYLLWCMAYEHERFIVIISDTADQAQDMLAHVKSELETNERLRADFPQVCGGGGTLGASGTKGTARWRKGDIVTGSGVRVRAAGTGQGFRGVRHKAERPTLIVLDDAENERDVRSDELRTQKLDWFRSTVSKAGTGTTNMVVVGTVLHSDSLLANLLDGRRSPGWTAKRYKALAKWPDRMDLWQKWGAAYNMTGDADGLTGPEGADLYYERNKAEMDKGAEVLWPEVDSLLSLMKLRARDGAASFEREKQNEPAGLENCMFREGDFHFWDEDRRSATQETLPEWTWKDKPVFASSPLELERILRQQGFRIVLGIDPSMGIPGRDFTGLVVVARGARSPVRYVLHAEMLRSRPDEVIEHVVKLCQTFDIRSIGFESVQFQALMGTNLRRRLNEVPLRVYIHDVKQTMPKIMRFQSLQPELSSGRLRLSVRHQNLITQLLQVPHGSHDDIVDALEIALRHADKPVGYCVHTIGGESV